MSSNNATPAINTASGLANASRMGVVSPAPAGSRSSTNSRVNGLVPVLAWSMTMRWSSTASSACACSIVTPGLKRPPNCTGTFGGASAKGSQMSLLDPICHPSNPRGATPTMVTGKSCTKTCRPRIAGSAWNRLSDTTNSARPRLHLIDRSGGHCGFYAEDREVLAVHVRPVHSFSIEAKRGGRSREKRGECVVMLAQILVGPTGNPLPRWPSRGSRCRSSTSCSGCATGRRRSTLCTSRRRLPYWHRCPAPESEPRQR